MQRAETDAIWGVLAAGQTLSVEATGDLLRDLERWRALAAYLASCLAATAEGLPKSASKSSRVRMARICEAAAAGLGGDLSRISHPTDVEWARKRCLEAGGDIDPDKATQAQ